MLCTLSMLSNSQILKFTRCIPIHTLIVDEASQIEVGNFLPVLFTAVKTLQKLCFIGDDKQCQCFKLLVYKLFKSFYCSIIQWHLMVKKKFRTSRVYLKLIISMITFICWIPNVSSFFHLFRILFKYSVDRMPPQMGDFISGAVYDGALKSNPNHVITDRTLACQFIHVPGVEIFKGNSFRVGTFFYLF